MSDASPSANQAGFYESLLQRQRLFEKLTKIQRSISHRLPLQEVLDGITAGASELLGDPVVALRLMDDKDPRYCFVVSSTGVPDHLLERVRRTPVDKGAGGAAIRENRLVVMDDYARHPRAHAALIDDGLRAAMAAPVREKGIVMGSLVVASYDPKRIFSREEQEALLALSEHAGLALSDAKTVEAMREAQGAKDLFHAMVSHELKTPLTVITGTLQTLGKHHRVISEEIRAEMIAAAEERAQELRKLINRFLAGARAELAAAVSEVGLPELVARAIRGFDQSRKLTVKSMPSVPVTVDVDAAREVIGILLENAVAHSPTESGISIAASVDDTHVAVTIRNSGSLPADVDPSSLFTPFSRGDANGSGVGLGLYIAYRLAQAIEGTIVIGSEDETVEFTLRFPVRPSEQKRLGHALRTGMEEHML
jgi:K+-sensing histidine kinase KdpD